MIRIADTLKTIIITMMMIFNSLSLSGDYLIFLYKIMLSSTKLFKRKFEILKEMKKIGFDSFSLILLTSFFTGFVTTVQTVHQVSQYAPSNMIGIFIEKTLFSELIPAITALTLCGKVGASIAAEVGAMKISEQLSSFKVLGISPLDIIYMPKVIAGIIMFPILTIYADFIGLISSFFLAKIKYSLSFYIFFYDMKNNFSPIDLWCGLIKSVFFGLIITSISCFLGEKTENGAEGVGKTATYSVVFSTILILISDFFVALLIFGEV